MSDTTPFDELVERIKRLTELDARASFKVADALLDQHDEGHVPTPVEIVDMATAMGFEVERKHDGVKDQAPANAEPLPEVTTNPVEVLKEMYLMCPRTLTFEKPRIGRVPRESVFYDEEMQEMLAQLPEHLKVLIGNIDLMNGELTVTLYDEANDLDRKIGPISLERFVQSDNAGEKLNDAIETLIKRLPVVLAADFN